MIPRILSSLLFLSALQLVSAQVTYRGTVTDMESNEPVELATVRLVQGDAEKLIEYGMTSNKGAFTINAKQQLDSLYVIVSVLGYRTYKEKATSGQEMKIHLQTESINLREVVIKPGRIWGRRDTINFAIPDFMSSKDETMKDVLKKLPGLDVDNSGKISYNGKAISNFYVEGMDLTDGRYNRINNNLKAQTVEAVQVLENHQAVRMLKDKINSNDIAINLKLKPEFKDKWMVNLQGGAGYSSNHPSGNFLWDNDINAMQLSRGSQSIYTFKNNNTGNDVTDENKMLIEFSSNRMSATELTGFIPQPSFMAPLKKERLLFNNVYTASANRLYKMNETSQLRFNTGYTHDLRQQERGSNTSYFQPNDTIYIEEQSNTKVKTDKVELSAHLENNGETNFLTNRLDMSALWEKGNSRYSGSELLCQQINTTNIGLKNEFRNLWNTDKHTFEIRSLVKFNHLPSKLAIDNSTRQYLNLNHFYTDNYFSLLKKKGTLTQKYNAGITAQTSNIQNTYGLYLTPNWQINNGKWLTNINLPATLTGFPGKDFLRPAINPSLSVRYKYNYAWQFLLFGNYKEGYGNLTDFYTTTYYTNYRHQIQNTGNPMINRNQFYTVSGEYKNTIREFFATLSVNHIRNWTNRIYEQIINGDQIILTSHDQSTQSSGWTINGQVAKGFFDYGLKLSLNYILGNSKAEQISMGEKVPFKSSYLLLEPKISWSPMAGFLIDYEGSFRYSGNKIGKDTELTPLWNMVQKINLSYDFTLIELGLAADHYYNDVSRDKGVHAFLMDVFMRWSSGSWLINLHTRNLFDKRDYGYTQYNSLQSYTSWINIRGRELLATVSYRF